MISCYFTVSYFTLSVKSINLTVHLSVLDVVYMRWCQKLATTVKEFSCCSSESPNAIAFSPVKGDKTRRSAVLDGQEAKHLHQWHNSTPAVHDQGATPGDEAGICQCNRHCH